MSTSTIQNNDNNNNNNCDCENENLKDIEDLEFGFKRKFEANEKLRGTTGNYGRQLLVCLGIDATLWPASFKDDPLTSLFWKAYKENSKNLKIESYLSACNEKNVNQLQPQPQLQPQQHSFDILCYPENIRFLQVTHEKLPQLIEILNSSNSSSSSITTTTTFATQPITKTTIFVCSHLAKDKRCGYCGPKLVNLFENEINKLNLNDKIDVRKISHVGGHKYAGNVIIYPAGNWYGNVKPENIEEIIQSIINNTQVKELWRGRMGLDTNEHKALYTNPTEKSINTTTNTTVLNSVPTSTTNTRSITTKQREIHQSTSNFSISKIALFIVILAIIYAILLK
eukprot:TRINITY_DN38_c1_g2_i1.p1 TRINITY_DN38_c1_g2~~TRINITY_DN38_c1_g2_i1.p1  ORF type:complete len:362 (+),score=165.28 TRINITY_DN38_c1_g2_i1:68-1087(+)